MDRGVANIPSHTLDSQNAANGPDVHLVTVPFLAENLGCNVVRCAAQSPAKER